MKKAEMANSSRSPLEIKKLTPRQRKGLQLILDGVSQDEVCEQLNITSRTLWNWRQLPAWDATLEVVLKADHQDGDSVIEAFYPHAISILRKLALTGTDGIKLAAIRTFIDARTNIILRRDEREMLEAMETQLSEIQVQVSNQRAEALNPSFDQAIEAEILPSAHDSAHSTALEVDESL